MHLSIQFELENIYSFTYYFYLKLLAIFIFFETVKMKYDLPPVFSHHIYATLFNSYNKIFFFFLRGNGETNIKRLKINLQLNYHFFSKK